MLPRNNIKTAVGHSACGLLLAPLKADEIRVEFCTLKKTQWEFNFDAKHTFFIVITCRQLNMKESENVFR